MKRLVALFWFAVILLGWAWFALPPAASFMEVRSLEVADARQGSAPHLSLDRTVHQQFSASWVAQLEVSHNGTSHVVCAQQFPGATYYPELVLPDGFDLDQVFRTEKCRPPPGKYRMRATWTIHPPGLPEKLVSVVSNDFVIR